MHDDLPEIGFKARKPVTVEGRLRALEQNKTQNALAFEQLQNLMEKIIQNQDEMKKIVNSPRLVAIRYPEE